MVIGVYVAEGGKGKVGRAGVEILKFGGETTNATKANDVTIVTFSMRSDRAVEHQANNPVRYRLR